MRPLRLLVLSVLTAVLLAGAAVGAGFAVLRVDGDRSEPATTGPASTGRASGPSSQPGGEPGAGPAEPSTGVLVDRAATPPYDRAEPPQRVAPAHRPFELSDVLVPGDRGERVRELQYRLYQLAWWPELTTGRYDAATRGAVAGFQGKRGFEPTGVVDPRTWARLLRMTRTPTRDQKFNILHPGPALYGPGAAGEGVRAIQARLVQIQWLFGDVTGTYDATTTEAVRGFQAKRGIPVTGEVDWRTMERLVAMTSTPTYEEMHNIRPEPGGLDPRCTYGRALCIDKSANSLRWVVDGNVQATYDVRFGSDELPTREGAFTVFMKSRDHVSSLYDTPMPYAMFFSGGQAVHYSPDFAANGYSGASHGCVNVRDYDGIVWLFDQVGIGDKVIVYWS